MSFTSDTCNVMKGARGGVIAKLRSVQPKIIDVHCICHLVNLCVKSAVKSLPLKVDDIITFEIASIGLRHCTSLLSFVVCSTSAFLSTVKPGGSLFIGL